MMLVHKVWDRHCAPQCTACIEYLSPLKWDDLFGSLGVVSGMPDVG